MENLSHPLPIFQGSHFLTKKSLAYQFKLLLLTDPNSSQTRDFRQEILAILDETSWETPLNHFPEGTEIANLPQHVQESYKHVQTLSSEKQSKISYYEKNREWFINLNGAKISLQNESASDNPDNGVNAVEGDTYFSHPAALAHAKSKWRSLPTNTLWTQMADFLGWFKALKNVLQIPLTGLFYYGDGRQCFGVYAVVWSTDFREYLCVDADGGCVDRTGNLARGRGVRLLDA